MDIQTLKENTKHGTVSFPLALYNWNGSIDFTAPQYRYDSPDWIVPLHWHDEMELIYFKEGKFPVWLNTREYLVEAPAILCIHPGELHSMTLPAGMKESAIVFHFNILSFEHYDAIQAKLIRPLMDGRLKLPVMIEQDHPVFSAVKEDYEKIEQKLRDMNTRFSNDEVAKNATYLQIKSILFDMLAVLYQNNCLLHTRDLKKENEYQIENLKKVLLYIQENYASTIRLEKLASLANLNAQYFCRYFKENIGKTVTEYINEVRIEKAAEALLETNDKIITIATNTGFETTGYFIRRFKKEKGITPSEYRKANKANPSLSK